MAEQPLGAEETGTGQPEGLVPPDDMLEGMPEDVPENMGESDGLSPPPSEGNAPQAASSGPVLLRERYLIDTGSPIHELDQPSAKAYAVEDRRDLSLKLYALACTPGLPVRMEAIRVLKGQEHTGILPLIDWDVVSWPPLGQATLLVIYERPLGGRVIDRLHRKDTRITEYDILRKVIEPLVYGLNVLSENGGPHRSIRPDNLYFFDDDMEDIVLGPHVTAPPGFDQPAIFEPVDRAICQPEGRGMGDIRDDLFSLAATIIHLLLGYNPVAKMKHDTLIQQRLENTSYTALCGNARLPLSMVEPIRSMLNDDVSVRWNFDEVNKWIIGEKTTPVKKLPKQKAEVPFRFRKREHISFQTLAWHFGQHPQDAARVIESEDFATWLKRYPSGTGLLEKIRGIVQMTKFHADNHQGSDDFLINKVSMVLAPETPIRYKGMVFMPDGYGPVLAVNWSRKGDPKAAAEALSHDVASIWFSGQERLSKTMMDAQKSYSTLRGMLAINEPGFGLERVVYESNPGLSCQSPLVLKQNVVAIEHLLPAMEAAASSADTSGRPVDRHIAAFIAARFDQDIHPHLKALGSPKEDTSVIGMLSLLAFLQWKLRAPSLLALSSWIGGLLGPAINAYHNRRTRDELEKEIPRMVRKGSMPEIFNLIDNAEQRREDGEGFRAGQEEWRAAEEEIRDIEGAGEERLTKAERSGQQAAATISIMLGLTVVSILSIMAML
jgi:hypothetical protein